MTDYITGDKFIGIGDFVYAPESNDKDCNPLTNTFCHCALRQKNIIYTHTMYVKSLFDNIRGLKAEFVIVTHNCDTNVDETFDLPSNVKMWYSQNVNVKHPRIHSIPIGLENNKWFKVLGKKDKMKRKLLSRKFAKNLVYLNVNVNTNPAERVPVYDYFYDKPWVTVERGVNGKGFDEYIDNIYNHKYVPCPRGNGIDTHRLWETLYMGSIPIVKKDINTWFYNALPILYVNDWTDVTEELLEDMYGMYVDGDYNREMLEFKYWKNLILKG
jgi:hypothetical protein